MNTLEVNFVKNYAKTHKELITNLKVNYKYNYYNINKTYVVPITYRQLGVVAYFGRGEYSKDIASIVQSSSDEVVVMRLSYSDYLSGKYNRMRFRIAPIYGENTDCPYPTDYSDYIWYSEIKSSSGKPVIDSPDGGDVVFNGTIYAGNEYKMVCDDLPGKCFYLKFVL
jgi:hypothetical protein